jgi:hypothetical protein
MRVVYRSPALVREICSICESRLLCKALLLEAFSIRSKHLRRVSELCQGHFLFVSVNNLSPTCRWCSTNMAGPSLSLGTRAISKG